MDELARRYLLLCLRLERLVPRVVDSYIGPGELAEAIAGEPRPLAAELHDEAVALRASAAELIAAGDPAATRGRWMDGQLRALAALARRAGGEEIAFLDLVEELYGIPIGPVPEADLLEARRRLDAALPGPGSLAERDRRFRDALRIAPDRVIAAVSGSAERFRRATRRDFRLPDEEGIDWSEAHDRPWGASARFLGGGRTSIAVNLDLPADVLLVAYLASHEAYPGHHAEHVSKEVALVAAGVGEATMRTMNTPEAMLAEGLADVAREVVLSDRELEAELATIGREAGLAGDWAQAVAVYRAERDLADVQANAALMLHHAGRPEPEVRDWVREVAATPEERIDHLIRFLTDRGGATYPFTYTHGARLIRPWLEVTGQTAGFARLLAEQLSPAQLVHELSLAAPPAPA